MEYTVKYRTADGRFDYTVVEAASRAAMFQLLEKRGISAISVSEGVDKNVPPAHSSPRHPSPMRGILAGVCVVVLAVGAYFLFFASPSTPTVVEGNVERYEFTWPGKRAAKAAASAATTKTLRPCREESVNFDTTENLYIEGDNLEVLKLLQTSYAGKVKMIYIDPPYNTGHDFVYRDRFSLTQKELEEQGGAFDEDGNRFEVNDSAEARYHSNWCSMMYPRLKLARNLLRDDGGFVYEH